MRLKGSKEIGLIPRNEVDVDGKLGSRGIRGFREIGWALMDKWDS